MYATSAFHHRAYDRMLHSMTLFRIMFLSRHQQFLNVQLVSKSEISHQTLAENNVLANRRWFDGDGGKNLAACHRMSVTFYRHRK